MPKTKHLRGEVDLQSRDITDDVCLNPKIKSAILEVPRSQHYLIGFSGGLDSLALIHFCVPFLRRFASSIKAIHVHHGLSKHADEWVRFCIKVCESIGLDLEVEYVQIEVKGEGLEAAARQSRYQVFSRHMQQDAVLLLGHHLNDQAETLLMRFLKGLGPSALKGISRKRAFAGGMIFRPWLNVPRTTIEQQLNSFTREWVEDESNQDRRFERNFLRHEVLPLLEKRRPSVLQDLHHAASRSADYVEFVEQWCRQHQDDFLSSSYLMENAIDLDRLRVYSELQQKFILRYWFDLLGVHQPGDANFKRILTDLITPVEAAKAEVVWRGHCVRAFDGALFCFRAEDLKSPAYEFEVCLADLLNLGDEAFSLQLPGGILSIEKASAEYESADREDMTHYLYEVSCCLTVEHDVLVIRSKRPGDRININKDFSQTLKKLYQSHRVLPWHRESLPVLLAGTSEGEAISSSSKAPGLLASLAGFVAHQHQPDCAQTGNLFRIRYSTCAGLPGGNSREV